VSLEFSIIDITTSAKWQIYHVFHHLEIALKPQNPQMGYFCNAKSGKVAFSDDEGSDNPPR
jgi:hypothetical protein